MFGKQKKLHFPKMPEKKQVQDVKRDDGVELENQFILRILEVYNFIFIKVRNYKCNIFRKNRPKNYEKQFKLEQRI